MEADILGDVSNTKNAGLAFIKAKLEIATRLLQLVNNTARQPTYAPPCCTTPGASSLSSINVGVP